MKETGFFHSGPQIYCNELRSHPRYDPICRLLVYLVLIQLCTSFFLEEE